MHLKEMTSCSLCSVLLNLPTTWVVLDFVWPLALLPASLTPGGMSSLFALLLLLPQDVHYFTEGVC